MRSKFFMYQKTALALAVGLYAGSLAAYQEAGVAGNTRSWESAEYLKDWGLVSMNASTAYALGFNGTGVNIGVMDSGVLLAHPEFQDGRIHSVQTQGVYSKDGMRYPDAAFGNGPLNQVQPFIEVNRNGVARNIRNFDLSDNGVFHAGEAFNMDGTWHKGINDAHGTHVSGTMAASRNGEGMHGVAFGANLYSANTGGNDNMTYGPNQDYAFFFQGYSALADAGVKVINNSWGSNRRVNSAFAGAKGYKSSYGWRDVPEYGVQYYDVVNAPQATTNPADHLYLYSSEQAQKAYAQFVTSGEKNFLDAAYDVATQRQVVQVFTAGNRSLMAQSFTRAALPYFRPDAEAYWVNVTGQTGGAGYPKDHSEDISDDGAISDIQDYNLAGDARWWTIAAPSSAIYSAYVQLMDESKPYGKVTETNYGAPIYKSANGTSMAAPHVSGALGVIFSRYPYMTPDQARAVMLTTARQTTLREGLEGKPLERWETPQGVPSKVWGWGILDLGKAMFGPGQFFGEFKVNLNQDDLWSNDISDVAIKARQQEDATEAQAWETRRRELSALMQTRAGATAEEIAEYQVGLARESARNAREAQGYQGVLVKNGSGTLTLSGNNSFTGEVLVNQGTLAALNQSLATSQLVRVASGAALAVLPSLEVMTPSAQGFTAQTLSATAQRIKAQLARGARFILHNGAANIDATFEAGAILEANGIENAILANPQQAQISVQGHFQGADQALVPSPRDYAFYRLVNQSDANRLVVSAQKQAFSQIARDSNEAALANALDNSPNSRFYQGLLLANRQQAYGVFDSLNYATDLRFQQHNLLNQILLTQKTLQTSTLHQGMNLWTSSDFTHFATGNLNSHAYNQLLGVDFAVNDKATLGAFVGSQQMRHKNHSSTKDRAVNLGLSGQYLAGPFALKLTLAQTSGKNALQINALNDLKVRSKTQQVALESAYQGWPKDNFGIEPYLRFSYVHVKTKGATKGEVALQAESRDLLLSTVGVRPVVPFSLGSVGLRLEGDVAYHRLHKDRAASASLVFNQEGRATLQSERLSHLLTTGVALQAQFTPAFSAKLGYQGVYSKHTRGNNLNAELSLRF